MSKAASRPSLRLRLKSDQPLIATFSIIDAPEIVEMVGIAGFDAVILDLEHGPYTVAQLPRLILAARARDLYAIVRVAANDPSQIGAVLDAGADGVLVPQIGSVAAAAAAVAAARYAPAGSRGANPWTRAADYGSGPEWFAKSNEDTAVLVMIEGKDGVAALGEIVKLPGLDAIFLGPVDLSHSLGVPGQSGHPLVVAEIERAIAAANLQGMATAVFSPTPDGSKQWRNRGARLLAIGEDTAHIMAMFRSLAAASR
jgi:4-hydroxy-2-oxoheptanedioate aldolase